MGGAACKSAIEVVGQLLGAVEMLRMALQPTDAAVNAALDSTIADARHLMKMHGATDDDFKRMDAHLAGARAVRDLTKSIS